MTAAGPDPVSEPFRDRYFPAAPIEPGEVGLTWLGTNCLVLSDGSTRLMIDPNLTRPSGMLGPGLFLKKIAPDLGLIDRWLARAGADRLDAVLLTHTHFDHALDAAAVAAKTGAMLLGSASAANVGRGG
ncbi:MAG: MBL fold metallo-hydrolase, partial [Proteobacteria bacterium]|nr:MBL fold metallo-hydrolase [Pseudomonadota bacterium]